MSIRRKRKISGGTKNNPYYEEHGPCICMECDVEARTIRTEQKFSSDAWPGGGRLSSEWDETLYRCPKCNKEEVIHGLVHVSNGSYHSNEERRAYGY